MRITAARLAILACLSLPTAATANEPAADFNARWPETPMRQPTVTELVRLVAGVLEQQPEIKAELVARMDRPLRCVAGFCGFRSPR